MATTVDELRSRNLDEHLSGLDALEDAEVATGRAGRVWAATWPKVGAVAILLAVWQIAVWAHWRSRWVLRPPSDVLSRLGDELRTAELWKAIGTTMQRGAWGFLLAVVVGGVIGVLVARFRILRSAVGSLITGLQTMPSIAWFPFAILMFRLSEAAITFVVVLGAAPSVANGLIHGIDHIPPNLTRAGRILGARGVAAYRHVILPAALPSVSAGLKQGWAFAWRSLMAGELIVIINGKTSLGQLLQNNREVSDAEGLMATMIVILLIGVIIDAAVFGTIERRIRRRRGLLGP